MYILNPIVHETIWGGTRLKEYAPGHKGRIGHLYMVNGHRENSNIVCGGLFHGKSLYEIFPEVKDRFNMDAFEEFPLTIALTDAQENLSIQVHPDDFTAMQLEQRRIGKEESWFFLEPPDFGWIYAGSKAQDKDKIAEAVAKGEMEKITARLPVEREAYICVPAGTLHAITAGSLVYEIEYGSDYTYRFFDYHRKDSEGKERELHVEKALQAIHEKASIQTEKIKPGVWKSEQNYEVCCFKNINFYRNDGEKTECFSVVNGEGTANDIPLKKGMSVLLLPGEQLEYISVGLAFVARLA